MISFIMNYPVVLHDLLASVSSHGPAVEMYDEINPAVQARLEPWRPDWSRMQAFKG
jgi:hypothetical protein